MERSERVKKIPPYLFAEINRKIAEAKAKGIDVISLGIGDPDMPTPQPIVEELNRAAHDPATHKYPDYEGMPAFREAVAAWYKRRHNVDLDYKKEVLALIGSKEGSLHLNLAFTNPGDYVLVPDPAYTTYKTGAIFADGIPYQMPLLAENNFLPDLSKIPHEIAKKASIIFICYPNNPTGAVATDEFYKELIDFAKDNDVIVCSDNPYSETTYDGYKAPSFLEYPGAMDVGIEFNSLSKPYNMTGWRIGMAVGNAELVGAIGITKNNTDSGVFTAVQYAGIKALSLPDEGITQLNKIYQARRDLVCDTLNQIGLKVRKPKATFYIWVPVPKGHTSASFAAMMLEKAAVVVTPGAAYGPSGEGYVRISIAVPDKRLQEAMERIKKAMK